jgi:hypothetical protein
VHEEEDPVVLTLGVRRGRRRRERERKRRDAWATLDRDGFVMRKR